MLLAAVVGRLRELRREVSQQPVRTHLHEGAPVVASSARFITGFRDRLLQFVDTRGFAVLCFVQDHVWGVHDVHAALVNQLNGAARSDGRLVTEHVVVL